MAGSRNEKKFELVKRVLMKWLNIKNVELDEGSESKELRFSDDTVFIPKGILYLWRPKLVVYCVVNTIINTIDTPAKQVEKLKDLFGNVAELEEILWSEKILGEIEELTEVVGNDIPEDAVTSKPKKGKKKE